VVEVGVVTTAVAQSSSAPDVRERGLLFKAPMMLAILNLAPGEGPPRAIDRSRPFKYKTRRLESRWRVGDLAWTKETWRTEERESDLVDGVRYRADDAFVPIEASSAAANLWMEAHDNGRHGTKWRPAIFQRKWMARALLEVTAVERQALGDMPPGDVAAEGVDAASVLADPTHPLREAAFARGRVHRGDRYAGALDVFAALWESIQGPGSWDPRLVVNVITFRRVR
jgi:hypothetical protein